MTNSTKKKIEKSQNAWRKYPNLRQLMKYMWIIYKISPLVFNRLKLIAKLNK